MAHDKNGKPVSAGDVVTLRCRVESIDESILNLSALDGSGQQTLRAPALATVLVQEAPIAPPAEPAPPVE